MQEIVSRLMWLGFLVMITGCFPVYEPRQNTPNYRSIAYNVARNSVGSSVPAIYDNGGTTRPGLEIFLKPNNLVLEKYANENNIRRYEYVEITHNSRRVARHIVELNFNGEVLYYEKIDPDAKVEKNTHLETTPLEEPIQADNQ